MPLSEVGDFQAGEVELVAVGFKMAAPAAQPAGGAAAGDLVGQKPLDRLQTLSQFRWSCGLGRTRRLKRRQPGLPRMVRDVGWIKMRHIQPFATKPPEAIHPRKQSTPGSKSLGGNGRKVLGKHAAPGKSRPLSGINPPAEAPPQGTAPATLAPPGSPNPVGCWPGTPPGRVGRCRGLVQSVAFMRTRIWTRS